MTAHVLDRVRARKMLQRTGIIDEPGTPPRSDPDEVAQLLGDQW